jgi:hypothetical protein
LKKWKVQKDPKILSVYGKAPAQILSEIADLLDLKESLKL